MAKIGGREMVYICSPLRADTPEGQAKNEALARKMCAIAWEAGFFPIAPHLYIPQFAPDSDPRLREQGLAAGIALLRECSRVFVLDVEPSQGMRGEIAEAKRLGIPVQRWSTVETVRARAEERVREMAGAPER